MIPKKGKIAGYVKIEGEFIDDLQPLLYVVRGYLIDGDPLKASEQIKKEQFKLWLNSPKENIGDHFA